MRARVDTDDTQHPIQIVTRIYDAAFFDALKSCFDFCNGIPDLENKIADIGRLYLALRRWESHAELQKSRTGDYLALKADVERFANALIKHDENLQIASDLRIAAISLGEPPPKTNFSDLTDHEKRSGGEPYLRELQRLLKVLVAAADLQAEYLDVRRGPKINFGLELMVRRVAELFGEDFRRPFTIDQHKPFKPTEAFLFIRALVDPLDDVSDDNIASAMRSERNRLRELDKRAANAENSNRRTRR
jgi:hypothetical protein